MKLWDDRPLEIHGHVGPSDRVATISIHSWAKRFDETIVLERGSVDGICAMEDVNRHQLGFLYIGE